MQIIFDCLKCSKIKVENCWREEKNWTYYWINCQQKDIYHAKCYRTSCKWYSYELRLCLFIGPVLQEHIPFTIHAVFHFFFCLQKIFKKVFLSREKKKNLQQTNINCRKSTLKREWDSPTVKTYIWCKLNLLCYSCVDYMISCRFYFIFFTYININALYLNYIS